MLPTKVVAAAVKDLKLYDVCIEEVAALNEQLAYAKQFSDQMDSSRVILSNQVDYLSSMVEKRDSTIINLNTDKLRLEKKLTSSKIWSKGLGIGLLSSILIGIFVK